jgi:hypothetical protein
MNEKIQQTLKSTETEDWLDYHVVRPLCYYCARFFALFHIHPNAVTILSMIIGAGSCVLYARGSWYYEGRAGLLANLLAIFLLMVADILDCTDGQLARMTGQKSRLGRILDGMAGFVWFLPIYLAMIYRFYIYHDLEFSFFGIPDTEQNILIATAVVFVLGVASGVVGISGQQRLADYYIQVHLYFLKGEKDSELDNSIRQQELYDQMPWKGNFVEKAFQYSYVGYTQKQEQATPQFQRLMNLLRQRYGTADRIPETLRQEFRAQSLPLMFWNGLLTFNFRSFWLFLFCLIDLPAVYFLFELLAMGLLCFYVNHRHESFCRVLADRLEAEG